MIIRATAEDESFFSVFLEAFSVEGKVDVEDPSEEGIDFVDDPCDAGIDCADESSDEGLERFDRTACILSLFLAFRFLVRSSTDKPLNGKN